MQKRSRRIDERSKKGYVLIVPTGRREVPVRGSRPMLQSGRRDPRGAALKEVLAEVDRAATPAARADGRPS